jgi:hypothetical protein
VDPKAKIDSEGNEEKKGEHGGPVDHVTKWSNMYSSIDSTKKSEISSSMRLVSNHITGPAG